MLQNFQYQPSQIVNSSRFDMSALDSLVSCKHTTSATTACPQTSSYASLATAPVPAASAHLLSGTTKDFSGFRISCLKLLEARSRSRLRSSFCALCQFLVLCSPKRCEILRTAQRPLHLDHTHILAHADGVAFQIHACIIPTAFSNLQVLGCILLA